MIRIEHILPIIIILAVLSFVTCRHQLLDERINQKQYIDDHETQSSPLVETEAKHCKSCYSDHQNEEQQKSKLHMWTEHISSSLQQVQ